MAITKIIKVKVNANAAINYVRNPDKTNERLLVSYDGCSESNIELCFKMALTNKAQMQNSNNVLAYHFIQSFAPTDEVTPEQETMQERIDRKNAEARAKNDQPDLDGRRKKQRDTCI